MPQELVDEAEVEEEVEEEALAEQEQWPQHHQMEACGAYHQQYLMEHVP